MPPPPLFPKSDLYQPHHCYRPLKQAMQYSNVWCGMGGYCLEKAQVVGIVGIVGMVGMVWIVGINK